MRAERTALLEQRGHLEEDPRWLLTKRVLSSATFAKSTRSSEFLKYVCKRALTGHSEDINEQAIGEHVFERSPGYDPGQDNIVRVQANRLRQKLDVYFQEESPKEPIRIVIPKGGYCPQFEAAPAFPVQDPPALDEIDATSRSTVIPHPESELPPTEERRKRKMRLPFMLLSVLTLGLLSCIAFVRFQTPGSSFPFLGADYMVLRGTSNSPIWSSLFERDRSTVIVPGDSGLVLYESQANRTVTLDQYLSGEVQTVPQINPSATLDSPTSKTGYRYTSIVDLNVASQLMYLPQAAKNQPTIRYARDLKLDDLKGRNVILIGAKDANPWVGLFEGQMNFVFDVNRTTHESTVSNRKPATGEEAIYHRYINDPANRAYALIALRPNLNNSGNVLIFEGTTAAGTEAAADFVFQGNRLSSVVKPDRNGHLPYFELLLQTTNIGGSAPESQVVGYRVYR